MYTHAIIKLDRPEQGKFTVFSIYESLDKANVAVLDVGEAGLVEVVAIEQIVKAGFVGNMADRPGPSTLQSGGGDPELNYSSEG